MIDLYRLIDAICEGFDQAREPGDPWYPKPDNPATPVNERATYCNFFVQFVAEKMGYKTFRGMLASQMVRHMRESERFVKLGKVGEAQDKANAGHLVIAGIEGVPHGHVAIVRPGVIGFSGKWQTHVPKMANVGAKNRLGLALGFFFPNPPEIWYLRD